ncbi:phosphocholine cytidylyltransferase family protein [Parerythrobacter aestuarii]|uniref:phosphocholine cytidylyltransferase family protein n=1 Tax=Parerythrobacter aestuarii TaxID=3020909 RepID=UPI0024DEB5F5|nr:NTP transferase domain-containing protein [Parerythrobacter aestuarii]
MDALILAAGLGSRLRRVEPCKPLTQLHGLSLLEIGVRQLASVGVKRVVVATGYHAEEIEAELPAIARRSGIAVEARRVADHGRPNGYSVIAGAADFKGEFLLQMADHVFARSILAKMMAAGPVEDRALLAIDRRLTSPLIDPDDATWVATRIDGTIDRIGKHLTTYDAVDCGVFRASQALPEAIQSAIHDGMPGSLSDGMQRLADRGQAASVDIGEAWWIDIDDPPMLEMATSQVRAELPEIFAAEAAVS